MGVYGPLRLTCRRPFALIAPSRATLARCSDTRSLAVVRACSKDNASQEQSHERPDVGGHGWYDRRRIRGWDQAQLGRCPRECDDRYARCLALLGPVAHAARHMDRRHHGVRYRAGWEFETNGGKDNLFEDLNLQGLDLDIGIEIGDPGG